MLAIIPFCVNFQALIKCLCDCYSIFPHRFQKENSQAMQVIGSKDILTRKTNDE